MHLVARTTIQVASRTTRVFKLGGEAIRYPRHRLFEAFKKAMVTADGRWFGRYPPFYGSFNTNPLCSTVPHNKFHALLEIRLSKLDSSSRGRVGITGRS